MKRTFKEKFAFILFFIIIILYILCFYINKIYINWKCNNTEDIKWFASNCNIKLFA